MSEIQIASLMRQVLWAALPDVGVVVITFIVQESFLSFLFQWAELKSQIVEIVRAGGVPIYN